MSALGLLMLQMGFRVRGSDAVEGKRIGELRRLGIDVWIGHDAKALDGADRVIASPAIPSHNAEVFAARRIGLPVQTRAEALAGCLSGRSVVCVSGSHGKTTTATMLALILMRAGLDPGFAIGGFARSLGGVNARLGRDTLFVLEACEAFGALARWQPSHCIVTNIDNEHVEHYGGEPQLRAAFGEMLLRTQSHGLLAICGDDPGAVAAGKATGLTVATFGISNGTSVRADSVCLDGHGSSFTVVHDGRTCGEVVLRVPGAHNVRNALGAITIALGLGLRFEVVASALHEFTGVDGRWQQVGKAADVLVIEDFAHHPAEIEATLAAARRAARFGGRIVVAFQPQLHSRVQRLATQFAGALSRADFVLLAPVESVGERPRTDSDEMMTTAMRATQTPFVALPSLAAVSSAALERLVPGDLFITLGSAAISSIGPIVLSGLQQRNATPERSDLVSELSISIGPTVPLPNPTSLLSVFFEHAKQRPDRTAIACGQAKLTYAELANAARALAAEVLRLGVAPRQSIAVCLRDPIERVIGLLGVMTAGATYLPIDTSLPTARIAFMLEDARVALAIADENSESLVSGIGATVLRIESVRTHMEPNECLNHVADGSEPAYIVYTSGTTGTPKGVTIDHAALCNVAAATSRIFGIDENSRVSNVEAFGYDSSIGDVAMALYAGACVACPQGAWPCVGAPFGRYLREASVTHLSVTPSALSTLPQRHPFPDLTHVIVGGEACPVELLERWAPGRRFFNAYGPTEAAITSIIGECFTGDGITIGRAIDNMQAYVLGDDRLPVSRGIVGELWLTGVGVAKEYVRRPELTEQRFVELRLPGNEKRHAYRTGDLACMLSDGRLCCYGRIDDQVKIRGTRVELGEVEAALCQHPAVAEAAVLLSEDPLGRPRLVSYVAYKSGAPVPTESAVAEFLSRSLPSCMIPAATVRIDAIPLTANGKRDREALSALPAQSLRANCDPLAPRTFEELALHEMLEERLRIGGHFGVRDTFEELGADSLDIASFFMAIEERFRIELPVEAFSDADTIEILGLHLERSLSKRTNGHAKSRADGDILHKQRQFVAAWSGMRRSPESLIFTHSAQGQLAPLFWCFQGNEEHEMLALHIGPERPLHGMRSGHLIFRYTDENVAYLASRYADEMLEMRPQGSFLLGGNCQGGTIAQSIATQLRTRGREVELLLLLDQGRFRPYGARVVLMFGANSSLNPYLALTDPDRIFKAAYPHGYEVEIVSGSHGNYFSLPNVEDLAATIATHLAGAPAQAYSRT